MQPSNTIVVVSNHDGKKYKMVMKGDLGSLTIGKVKRYLNTATGVEPTCQVLRYNNRVVDDGTCGAELGLFDGAVMYLDVIQPSSSPTPNPTQSPSLHGLPPRSPVSWETRRLEELEAARARDLREIRELRERSAERDLLYRSDPMPAIESSQESRPQPFADPPVQRQRERVNNQVQQELDDLRTQVQLLQSKIAGATPSQQPLIPSPIRPAPTAPPPPPPQQFSQLSMPPLAPPSPSYPQPSEVSNFRGGFDATHNVSRNLENLAAAYSIPPLILDANNTCVMTFDGDNCNLLLTFDPVTERLFIYSAVLNQLPNDPMRRLKLYETLLEGALLGRDMAGGGVGVSLKNGLILMSTSLDMQHCDELSLVAAVKPFTASVIKWIQVLDSLEKDSPHHRHVPTDLQPAQQGSVDNSYHGRFVHQQQHYHHQPTPSFGAYRR